MSKSRNRYPITRRSRIGLGVVAGVFLLIATILIGQLFNLQVLQGDYYQKLAGARHFSKVLTYPERGKISAANGEILALTTYVYTIGITPAAVRSTAQGEAFLTVEQIQKEFATRLNLPESQVQSALAQQEASYVVLRKGMPKEEYDAFAKFLEEHLIRGVAVDALPRRYYPKGDVGCQVIGFANTQDRSLVGVTGLEAYYDSILAGKPGYTYGEVDYYFGGQLPYTTPTESAMVPGSNLVVNLVPQLQAEVQKTVHLYQDLFSCTEGAAAIVLDAKTGAVLAMAQETSFDLNQPYLAPTGYEEGVRAHDALIQTLWGVDPVLEKEESRQKLEEERKKAMEEIEKLEPGRVIQGPPTPTALLQVNRKEDELERPTHSVAPEGVQRDPAYVYKGWDPFQDQDDLEFMNRRVWANRSVTSTYEPGSTMKTFTVATAMEEHAFTLEEQFSDSPIWIRGFGDYAIHCHIHPKNHGYETVEQALGNSCNPVMVQIAERVGIEKFYEYIHALGLYGITGIDQPAEAYGILHKNPNIVDLAPISFGESNTITPMMLATAYTVFANDGVLLKPHVVKYWTDPDEKIIREFAREPVRQVYSKETVQAVRAMLRSAVTQGIVNQINVPGYFVGGKSGTSTKSSKGNEEVQDYAVMSTAALFPIDDPQYIVLGLLYNPNSDTTGGVQSMVHSIIRSIGRNLHVPKRYTDSDLNLALQPIELSYANGITLQSIAEYLASLNVELELSPGMKSTDFFYMMYPAGTQKLNGYPVYYVSQNGDPPKEQVEVPDFVGKTFEEAADLAYQKRINIRYVGNPLTGVVVEQSVPVNKEDGQPNSMQKYDVVELTFGPLPGYNPPQITKVQNPVAQSWTGLPIQTDPIWTTQYIYNPYGAIPEHNPYGG